MGIFFEIFRIRRDKEGWVLEHRKVGGDRMARDPKFRRRLRDWELKDAKAFFDLFELASVPTGAEDTLIWARCKEVGFADKSYYLIFKEAMREPFPLIKE